VPFFYSSHKLIDKIEGELSKNLNIDFNLSEKFDYSFFPRPHFTFEQISLLNELQDTGTIKVDIPINKLLFFENIKIKDIVLNNINFNIHKNNYNFFTELLKNDFSNFKFEIKNSNIFFRNIENDVLFINKIDYLKYYYDKKKLSNFLVADNEIFNLLYDIKFNNDFVNKKITSVINSSSLKLKIENNLDYKDSEKKEGLITVFYNKKKSDAIYNYSKRFI
jgi:disulfide oxidoreductase YuzD